MKNMQLIGESLLPVIAYGDAAGLPFETKQSDDIPPITGLHAIDGNAYIGAYPAGTWSDDTHLSIAVARGLIDANGFSIISQAATHVAALKHIDTGVTNNPDFIPAIQTSSQKTGWGGSTKRSVERLAHGCPPSRSGERGGAGNGVVMKLAPLALWQYVKQTPRSQRDNEARELTRMTHVSDEATLASAVHNEVLQFLLSSDTRTFDEGSFLQYAAGIAERYETKYRTNSITSEKLSRLALHASGGSIDTSAIHSVATGGGFYVPETLAMVYGSFVNSHRFPESVYRVIGLGGDTDSTSSLTATMSLFLHGSIDTPDDFEQTFDYKRLRRISADLTRCALQG